MTEALLPCPFCGADVSMSNEGDYHQVVCQDCGSKAAEYLNNTLATLAWNTRPPLERPVPQVREALEQIIETDDLGHCATLARDALAALTARPSDAAVAWLIEWPEDDNVPVRWWNPVYGWMRDANRAVHFERQSDAEDYITSSNWAAGVRATQHKFGLALPPDEPARVTPSTVGVEDIACEYSGVFGTPPRVCVNKDQCHRVGQCYYKKSPSQPAQDGRLKRCPPPSRAKHSSLPRHR